MTTLAVTRRNTNPYLPIVSDETTMHSEIEAVVNGGLQNDNFKPLALPVTTLSGLTPRKGKVVVLQVFGQNTPFAAHGYQNIRFIYDDALGKWVSANTAWHHQHQSIATTTSFVWDSAPSHVLWLNNCLSLYNAGVRPQIWIGAKMTAAASATTRIRYRIVESRSGSMWAQNIYISPELTTTAVSATYKVMDWTTLTPSATPSAGYASGMFCLVEWMHTGSQPGTVAEINAYLRWVSA